jgi:hypothetical protein
MNNESEVGIETLSSGLRRRIETITGYIPSLPSPFLMTKESKKKTKTMIRVHDDDSLRERFRYQYLHPIQIHQTCAIVAALTSENKDDKTPSSSSSSLPSLVELARRDPPIEAFGGTAQEGKNVDGRSTLITPSVCITSSAIGNVDYRAVCDDHIWVPPPISIRLPTQQLNYQPYGLNNGSSSIRNYDNQSSSLSLSMSLTISVLCHYGRARAALWQLVREQSTLMRFIGGPRGIHIDRVGDGHSIQFDARHWSLPHCYRTPPAPAT